MALRNLCVCLPLLAQITAAYVPPQPQQRILFDADIPRDNDAGATARDPHRGYGHRGAVASESSVCSKIGTEILLDGGNAADALVATTLCVGVIGMQHGGIGGGGFMLVRSAAGDYEYIDFRESAPAAATQDMYKHRPSASERTGLASGVPGELRGLEYLHDRYGKLPWRHVVMPAVRVARHGFPITADLVRYMKAAVGQNRNFLVEEPTWAIDFAPNGTLLGEGDILTRRRLADTLETIADRGASAFYTGPIAQTMIDTITRTGGIMTMEDLADYRVLLRPVANITYRGYRVFGCTAPTSGAVALSALKILEGYPDLGHPETKNISTHYFDEALRFAYGQRTELGDPDYVPGLAAFEQEILTEETAAAIRAKINPAHTLDVAAYNPSGYAVQDTPGTSAIVAADASGLAISLTTTVNLLFGSQIMVPETGVILNNEMDDFSIPGKSNAFGYVPSPANYIRPGKRPLSSIVPTIVEHASNGSLYFITAAAGGSRILTAVLNNLWHVLDANMTASQAIAQPRLHNQLLPNYALLEYGFDNGTVAFLEERGVDVVFTAPVVSAVQQIRVLQDDQEKKEDEWEEAKGQKGGKGRRMGKVTFEAASEPRQKASGGYAV